MVLVVGGAGYIGSHMVKRLLEAEKRVVTLDNLSTGHRFLVPGGEFIQGDLGDKNLLENLFTTYPIRTVMHFAAFSIVGESVTNPIKYYENNVCRTMNLISAMVKHKVREFIFSSTAAVYGEPETIPITEETTTAPVNPYGHTKLTVEQILKHCSTAYGLRYILMRYFNAAGADESGTIGESHKPETHLIPLVLKAAKGERKNITLFGTDYPTPDGTCIRDYIHVSDLAEAHLLALHALEKGEQSNIFNLGNNRGYSVKEVIETAEKVTQKEIPIVEGTRRTGDPAVLIANSDKIRSYLGWKPRYPDLDTIITSAWKWENSKP